MSSSSTNVPALKDEKQTSNACSPHNLTTAASMQDTALGPWFESHVEMASQVSLVRHVDPVGPILLPPECLLGACSTSRGDLNEWPFVEQQVLSQNSSKRRVHRALWVSKIPGRKGVVIPCALKFVADGNARDGRSIKREVECHMYIFQKLTEKHAAKDIHNKWPCAELIGYVLANEDAGQCVLLTRKLSGPDFFDIIRAEITGNRPKDAEIYEFHKLRWCSIAMRRIRQLTKLGVRHNDIKPDNLVLDYYQDADSQQKMMDVKIIDLGTASMEQSKDFTGGTSWYESPEQKVLEFHTKRRRNPALAKTVDMTLASDLWSAGLTVTEVLMGKRAVDTMKPPHGPGTLSFRGHYSDNPSLNGWEVDPDEWILIARKSLGLEKTRHRYPVCAEAARWIFHNMVRVTPTERASLDSAIHVLEMYTEKAYKTARHRSLVTRSPV